MVLRIGDEHRPLQIDLEGQFRDVSWFIPFLSANSAIPSAIP